MKQTTMFSVAFAALLAIASTFSPPANAAPMGKLPNAKDRADVTQVHYRSYRHCHWRHGHRWCHGPDYGYYDYDYGPNVTFGFSGHRHHRHHHGGVHHHGGHGHGHGHGHGGGRR